VVVVVAEIVRPAAEARAAEEEVGAEAAGGLRTSPAVRLLAAPVEAVNPTVPLRTNRAGRGRPPRASLWAGAAGRCPSSRACAGI
jgi:hypothetical protein